MKCPIEFKICFLTTCEEVVVHTNCKRHVHMEDTEYSNAGPNLVWNVAQTDIVMQGVKNEASTKVIMRNLKDSNVFAEGKFPSRSQLTVKIRHCRNIIRRTIQIFDTHELRQKISEKLDIPENSTDSYIAFHEVLDDDDDKEPRFTIIWTSKKLLKRVSESLTQDDATYRYVCHIICFSFYFVSWYFLHRLNWQGYPFFVSGRSTPTGKFFSTHVCLASHEDTHAWKASYNFVKEICVPRYIECKDT